MTFPSLLDNIRDDKNMTFSMTESPDVTGRKVFVPLITPPGEREGEPGPATSGLETSGLVSESHFLDDAWGILLRLQVHK